jgi:hypothetical protein
MFMMKYGIHSAMQSTSASPRAVEISIAQLLPVLSIFTSHASGSPGPELVLGD